MSKYVTAEQRTMHARAIQHYVAIISSATEIDRRNLLPLVSELVTDNEAGDAIAFFLTGRKVMGGGTACRRHRPTGQCLVTYLRVVMSQAVELRQPGTGGVPFIDAELLDVVARARDQGAEACQAVGALQDRALLVGPDRVRAGAAALGPGRLQGKVIAPIGVARLELERLLPAQAEGGLEREARADMLVGDLRERLVRERRRLGGVADVDAPLDTVVIVVLGDDATFPYLVRPPAQDTHAVFDGAGGEGLALPVFKEGLDVFGFQALGVHVAIAEVVQLIGHELEDAMAVLPGGETAINMGVTELLELVVQVSHCRPPAIGCWR